MGFENAVEKYYLAHLIDGVNNLFKMLLITYVRTLRFNIQKVIEFIVINRFFKF